MRAIPNAILVLALALAVTSGCDSARPPMRPLDAAPAGPAATGGASGVPGSGGTPGGAAGSGGAAGPPASACAIPCIADLTRPCVPAGDCVEQGTAFGASNRCYSNGVKVMTRLEFTAEGGTVTLTTKRSDGGLCYTIDGTVGLSVTMAFKDATGRTVGTGTHDVQTATTTISCDGQTYDSNAVASCAGVLKLPTLTSAPGAPGGCAMGSCSP